MKNTPKPHDEQIEGQRIIKAVEPGEFIKSQVQPLFFGRTYRQDGDYEEFDNEESFWKKATALSSVCLSKFRISDWFPRTPGVYHSKYAERSRNKIYNAKPVGDISYQENLGHFFDYGTKMDLVEKGGIGTIRLRPRRIDNTDCWLASAIVGQQCAGGIPLAVPNHFLKEAKLTWGDTVKLYGEVRCLQEAGLDDTAAYVHHASPFIVFVDRIETLPRKEHLSSSLIATPVVLFELIRPRSEEDNWHDRLENRVGYAFVQSIAHSEDGLSVATDWIETYINRYKGRAITNFDEVVPAFSNAPLSYQRLVKKNYDRTYIKNLYYDGDRLADRIDSISINSMKLSARKHIVMGDNFVNSQVNQGVIMRDQYNSSGQAGAIGPGSSATGNTFQQMWQQNQSKIDLPTLASELDLLRKAMREKAEEPDHDIALGAVANAQTAAKQGDGPKALEHLKNSGTWALDIANKIGVGVATAAIKLGLGL